MLPTAPIRRARPSEEGFILVSVMFLLALLIIAMTVAMPRIIADIQRDREVETYRRGMQYRRAIQLYFRKFNRYPPNVEALVKTNNIRFLRKKYVDPITGKDDWKPIMFGQQKTPLAMGFFGQPLGGGGFGGPVMAGTGPGGVGNTPISTPIGGAGASDSGNPNDPNNNANGGQNAGGNPNDPTAGGQNTGGNPNDPTAGGGQITGANPIAGPAFGGGGIVGFEPASPKQSILVYKKKNHYNEWEFTYSPLSDMGMGGMPAQPPQLLPGQAPGTGGLNPMGPTPTPTPLGPTPTPMPAPQQ
jgi:type II secretory pathway pseudopilin PulG